MNKNDLKLHCYPEEIHRSFYYCYFPALVLCGESFESLNLHEIDYQYAH